MPVFVVVADEPFPEMQKRLEEYNPLEIGPATWLIT